MTASIPTSSIPLPILSSLNSRSPARFTVDLPLSSRRLNSAIAPPKFSGVDIFRPLISPIVRKSPPMAGILVQNPVTSDLLAAATAGAIALGLLRFWEVAAKRGIEQKLNRKLVHTSVGLVFMLCWPLFSSGWRGAVLAGLIPGVNILKMLLLGLGIMKDDATVKSISRDGSPRELLKGPLYYALTITFATMVYWRTSPIGIAAICNLCAGDGMADIVGRMYGSTKLPFNRNKSFAGSIAMAISGFLASVGYMYYFSMFGFIQRSPDMVLGFLAVSLIATVVESLSTEFDDNLTVPVVSLKIQMPVSLGREDLTGRGLMSPR
ncbi:hypothetical protein V2J09_020723 [Rumex salicifolius]